MKNKEPSFTDFQTLVWEQYTKHRRPDLPWRQQIDPYRVMVSEVMLQQTQVSRVIPKFLEFLVQFPTATTLANAPLAAVLIAWNGLGYNRRAKFLWQAARLIVNEHEGRVPSTLDELVTLPGIGKNTAAAIMVYAHNQPMPFIETNIRTVYLHHFFADSTAVSDSEILALVADTMDRTKPREWFWALMDYGSYLKKQSGGLLSKSKQYKKQSRFVGSPREMRGRIVRALTSGDMSEDALKSYVAADDRFNDSLRALAREGIIAKTGEYYHLTGHADTLDNKET